MHTVSSISSCWWALQVSLPALWHHLDRNNVCVTIFETVKGDRDSSLMWNSSEIQLLYLTYNLSHLWNCRFDIKASNDTSQEAAPKARSHGTVVEGLFSFSFFGFLNSVFRLYLIARLPKSPRLTPFSSHAEYHRERSVWAAFTLTYFYMTFCLKPLKPNFDWTYYSKRKEKICTAQENNVLASLWKAAIIFIYLFIHSFIHSFIYDTAAVISYCSRQAPVQANYARDSQAPSIQGGSSIQGKEAARVFHYLFPEVVSLGSYLDLNSFTYSTGSLVIAAPSMDYMHCSLGSVPIFLCSL